MRPRHALLFFLAGAGLLFAAFVVVVGVLFARAPGTDCSTVRLPPPGAWATYTATEKRDRADDLERCGSFDGLSTAALTTHLGPPDRQGTQGDGSMLWVYLLPHAPTATDRTPTPDELRLTLTDDGTAVESVRQERVDYSVP